MRSWKGIVLHHSAISRRGSQHYKVRHYHTKGKGWQDIGYHFLVDEGSVYDPEMLKVVGTGDYISIACRPMDLDGAHCLGKNSTHLGICFAGNFEERPMDTAQWEEGLKLVRGLVRTFGISLEDVRGHREVRATLCPGRNFDLAKFRGQL